eukprot:3168747-Rhodomonas_salina.1
MSTACPSALATVIMSLSPLPQQLTNTHASCPHLQSHRPHHKCRGIHDGEVSGGGKDPPRQSTALRQTSKSTVQMKGHTKLQVCCVPWEGSWRAAYRSR